VTPIPREFFAADALAVAPRLLGCLLRHRTTSGSVTVRLTEVEAYLGERDPGSHAYRGRTPRNAVMFGPPGHVYVYFTYGMHYCMNLVCSPEGTASAVLLRAGEVVAGLALARSRRPGIPDRDLARGPARLTLALGIDKTHNGVDACDPDSCLSLEFGDPIPEEMICCGPRVGVTAAADVPWRFWIRGEPTVSAYRPHVRRRRAPSRAEAGSRG
jgi:DNA-3-methyladenine glycosylase